MVLENDLTIKLLDKFYCIDVLLIFIQIHVSWNIIKEAEYW